MGGIGTGRQHLLRRGAAVQGWDAGVALVLMLCSCSEKGWQQGGSRCELKMVIWSCCWAVWAMFKCTHPSKHTHIATHSCTFSATFSTQQRSLANPSPTCRRTRQLTAELLSYNPDLRVLGYARAAFTWESDGSIKGVLDRHCLSLQQADPGMRFGVLNPKSHGGGGSVRPVDPG